AEPERIFTGEVVEVPIDELPVEAVVVGDENERLLAKAFEPGCKSMHHLSRVVERRDLLAGEAADVERFGDPEPRDGPETCIKSSREPGLDRHRAEADHGVVSGDRAVRLDV